MNEGEISVSLGKAQAYLSVVRNNSKEKYLRMLSFDKKNKYNSMWKEMILKVAKKEIV
jgi:hypothetical protein